MKTNGQQSQGSGVEGAGGAQSPWGIVLLTAFVTAVVVGGGVWMWQGSVQRQSMTVVQTEEKMMHMEAEGVHSHDDSHTHDVLEIDGGLPVPTVDLQIKEDSKSGWNIRVLTTNFRFAPENASGEHVASEGHAHMYVDGVKIGRLYGEWYHLDKLAPGKRVIRVTLNSNDHRDYVTNGAVIEDAETIDVR